MLLCLAAGAWLAGLGIAGPQAASADPPGSGAIVTVGGETVPGPPASGWVVPPEPIPNPEDERGYTLVPIPIAASDPNFGFKWGVLLPFFSMRDDATAEMWVPSVTVSTDIGTTFTGRYFSYGHDNSKVRFEVSQSTRQNTAIEAELRFPELTPRFGIEGYAAWRREQSERFFGIGPDADSESSYAVQGPRGWLDFWWRLAPHWRVGLAERWDVPRVRRSVFELPQTRDVHASAPGVARVPSLWFHGVKLQWDTRDHPDFPTRGMFIELQAAGTARALGSSLDSTFLRLEARGLTPLVTGRVIAVGRMAVESVAGPGELPFQALSSLGGQDRFRGGPRGRFADRRAWYAGAELRFTPLQPRLFGFQTALEIAPFIDVGQVFDALDDLTAKRLQVAGGMAVRLLIRPRVLGAIDFGVGREGTNVFTSLHYSF